MGWKWFATGWVLLAAFFLIALSSVDNGLYALAIGSGTMTLFVLAVLVMAYGGRW